MMEMEGLVDSIEPKHMLKVESLIKVRFNQVSMANFSNKFRRTVSFLKLINKRHQCPYSGFVRQICGPIEIVHEKVLLDLDPP